MPTPNFRLAPIQPRLGTHTCRPPHSLPHPPPPVHTRPPPDPPPPNLNIS